MSNDIANFTRTGSRGRAGGGLNLGGSLAAPAMMAVDNASNIYVTDNLRNDVERFDTTTGNLILMWGSPGGLPGQYNNPVGVAVDSLQNLYVGDSNNFRVQKFSASTGS